ncbi:p53-like transcription factor [Saccharata proteae CBS 121410]|uniref:P53-like transcription factor n=1 Tax=Saccharata proteae CBS 121410 TaxID=1314787 RepID=A0A9P4LW36_9PEZI|nr:p53-like transcription factor [Saccharata proteae CBS 121410]
MEGFDTLTMSYLAAPMSLSNVTAPDSLNVPLLPLDNLDGHSNFDAETFAGSEDATYTTHGLQAPAQQASMKRFSSTYEDPFSDQLSAYDQPSVADQNGPDSPSIERDNKLLSFSLPSFSYTLLDYAYRRTSISLAAQLRGMFFLAESPWASAGDNSAPPTELTCYRRNLFQITGNITLPRTLQYIMTEQGEQVPVLGQELTISATESVEGNPVKIISVPWKTPASSTTIVEDKTEKEPPSIPLDLSTSTEMDSEFVSFPIAWKRLQFRIATANNGRRKELQQHFVVKLKVMATLSTGQRVSICEVQSGAIIVRGRSPRNFQSRKDFPISGGGSTARKAHNPTQPNRGSTGDSNQTHHKRESSTHQTVEIPQMPFQFDPNDTLVSPDFFEWKIPAAQTGAMTAIPPAPASYGMPSAPAYAQSSPDVSRHTQQPRPSLSAPINLSLTDDEPKKPESPSDASRKVRRFTQPPPRAPSFSLNLISSPDESADLLYEYFPLGLDDWMPPVDAVYRPHVVHHMNLPQDPKAMAVRNRSKRYFSEQSP